MGHLTSHSQTDFGNERCWFKSILNHKIVLAPLKLLRLSFLFRLRHFPFGNAPIGSDGPAGFPSGLKRTTLNPLSEIRRHLLPRSVDKSVPLGPTATKPISLPDTYWATQVRNPVGGTRGDGVAHVWPPLEVKA